MFTICRCKLGVTLHGDGSVMTWEACGILSVLALRMYVYINLTFSDYYRWHIKLNDFHSSFEYRIC